MYTIGQASLRSGVAVSLIRAWERRYGILRPARTPSGYRLYDDDAIARLRAMRGLIERGWSARQAAAAVLAQETTPRPRAIDAPEGGSTLIHATARYDPAAVEGALDDLFGRGSFEAVIDDLVLPAAVMLGEAWADGQIDVAAEHLASNAISRRLSALFDQGGLPGSGPRVLVGLPPDSRHELGALAFAVALRRLGVDVLYLGADVPVESWADAATESAAQAAVVGVVTARDVSPAMDVATALRAGRPDLVLAFGGGSAAGLSEIGEVTVLPIRVVEAAEVLRGRLR
ncbi:MAG: MerR family transcriptional regulator [Chloroflexi bacterium]|nr:MerR family transcriptional regulator [Chloroflexota bacterium]